ncbi:MAG: 2-oxo-4-hydroxy-4-carboxy-5-ureidoimidazoline decarboxylase [Leptolyngbyaceae bacterium]|nr:2-oxo-4-hydroxy-4-carboxy-5-ureidoimidazoline decarboxylase [Leptolyngbyaceae bacterium]
MPAYSISQINQMTQDAFVQVLGAVFEETPAIAQQAWHHRPFADVRTLHQQMVTIVLAMTPEQQLALIQAHPDLGSKAAMATASVQEQTGAGLTQLTPDEYERLRSLNQAYQQKFGFPFIIAVKNHTKATILEAFEQRLSNTVLVEREQAIAEITQIAHFRLLDLVADG